MKSAFLAIESTDVIESSSSDSISSCSESSLSDIVSNTSSVRSNRNSISSSSNRGSIARFSWPSCSAWRAWIREGCGLRVSSSSDVGFFSGSRIASRISIGTNSPLASISVILFLRSLSARRALTPLRYSAFSAFLTASSTALWAFRRALSFSFLAFDSFISRACSTLRGPLGLRLRRFIVRACCCSYKRSWIF